MMSLVGGSVVGSPGQAGGLERSRHLGAGVSESGGARHAALLLHAMDAEDRVWVLNALSESEQASMHRLLAELEALGIERDATLVAQATTGIDFDEPPEQTDEARLMALDAVGVQRAVDCLRAEPVGLIVQWLRMAPWPWKPQLIQALEPVQRRRLEEALSTPPTVRQSVPPAMRAALIAEVARYVRSAPESESIRSPWQQIRHSVGSLWAQRRARRSTQR